ncbi:MAG: hypothetical protein K0Q74_118 [Gammaproteobacteria bacterium]|nr:hypothetical protein [Gammaproteobacteria bacterium]
MQKNNSISEPIFNQLSTLWIFLGAVLFSIFVHSKNGMDSSWDTTNYHVFIGWAATNFKGYEFGAVAQYHTYLNPLIDVMNFLAFEKSAYIGAAIHSWFYATTTYIVYKILKLFFTDATQDRALLAAGLVISCTGAMTLSLLGSWTNENINAVPVLLGLLLLLHSIRSENLRFYFLSGVVFGIALGLKLTAAHYFVGAIAAIAATTRFKIKFLLLALIGFVLGYFAIDGYFMYLRWETVSNPLFPLANNFFKSPYFPESWKSFGHFEVTQMLDYLSLPITWLYSGKFSEISSIRDGRFLIAYFGIFFIGLSFVFKHSIEKIEWALVIFFVGSFLAWIFVFRTYRYLVSLEMISGVLFVVGIKNILGEKRIVLKFSVIAISSIFLVTVTTYPNWGRRDWSLNFTSSNIANLIENKRSSIVFLSDQNLSYLAPILYKNNVTFANLYSQSWWDGVRASSIEDPDATTDPKTITLENYKNVYFLQKSRSDLRSKSKHLSNIYSGKYFYCVKVKTNMAWQNPYLCAYKQIDEMPVPIQHS